MNDIEKRILGRAYLSPGRARAGVGRSAQPKSEKTRLLALIDLWEAEGPSEPPVIGGMPAEAHDEPVAPAADRPAAELVSNGRIPESEHRLPLLVNLNTRVRARLTSYGIFRLYSKRDEIPIPADLVSSGGVWTTTLWQFAALLAGASAGDDAVVEGNTLELLPVGA